MCKCAFRLCCVLVRMFVGERVCKRLCLWLFLSVSSVTENFRKVFFLISDFAFFLGTLNKGLEPILLHKLFYSLLNAWFNCFCCITWLLYSRYAISSTLQPTWRSNSKIEWKQMLVELAPWGNPRKKIGLKKFI